MSFHSQAAEVKERMDMDDEERRGMLHILERSIIMSAQILILCFLVYLICFQHVVFSSRFYAVNHKHLNNLDSCGRISDD